MAKNDPYRVSPFPENGDYLFANIFVTIKFNFMERSNNWLNMHMYHV